MSSQTHEKIEALIIGVGSAGERHAAAQKRLGSGVYVFDSNPERARHIAEKYGVTAAIISEIYKVLFEDKSPGRALEDLMSREAREELKQY